MKTFNRSALILLSTMVLLGSLFSFLYHHDNKYTNLQPVGKDGVLTLNAGDLEHPIFLIDGWLLTINGKQSETFIGQYSNFSYAPGGTSPFGSARYDLDIRYTDPPRVLTLEIPEIFTEYILFIDEEPVAANGSGTTVSFLADSSTQLTLEVRNHSHYYSGLYYPPALGLSSDISFLQFIRNLFYGIVTVSSFTLAVFSALLWTRRSNDPLFFHFGILCLFFALSCVYPFLWQMGCSSPLRYALEDCSRLIFWVQALAVAAQASSLWDTFRLKRVYPILLGVILLCFFMIVTVIPEVPQSIPLFGILINLILLFTWLSLAVITGVGLSSPKPTSALFSLAGCVSLGTSLFANFLDNNLFEPIFGGWQSEWAGFLMVLIFEGLCVWHASSLLKENKALTQHLEETVAQRTSQLESVILERKNFFSDMAHNLKAPIAAIHGFLSLIQQNSIGVDDELRGYLALIQNKNMEIERRVQSLNTLNAFDRITQPREHIEINHLMEQVESYNKPEADALGILFSVGRLPEKAYLYAQPEKMLTLFENLIFNALSVTPMEGSIQIFPYLNGDDLVVTVADTGCGISPEKLPHIFERFYVGRPDSSEGSGLGLYICHLTVRELGGNISVQSHLDLGTVFTITLPLSHPTDETP